MENTQSTQQQDTIKQNYLTTDPTLLQQLQQLSQVFDKIEQAFPIKEAIQISQDERLIHLGEVEFDMTPFTYGEIDFNSFADILLYLKQKHGLFNTETNQAVFYDLGSGLGKPSITAALTLREHLLKCIGIEYLPGLYQKSMELKEYYDNTLQSDQQQMPVLEFKQDDFLNNTEWVNDADIIFANATCFQQEWVDKISQILSEKMKQNGIVIITTKTLKIDKEDIFEQIGQFKKNMQWGATNVTVYRKK